MPCARKLIVSHVLAVSPILPLAIPGAQAAPPVILHSSSTPTTLTITGVDLCCKAATALLGSSGPAGATGPLGAPGATGATGPVGLAEPQGVPVAELARQDTGGASDGRFVAARHAGSDRIGIGVDSPERERNRMGSMANDAAANAERQHRRPNRCSERLPRLPCPVPPSVSPAIFRVS